MKKKLVIILSIFLISGLLLSVLLFLRNDNTEYTEEEIKFKDEYENLNGFELMEGYVLKNINIDVDNNIKYVSDNNIIDILTNGTNVIYFGWADCNWCRSIVPTLIETLKENNIQELYYYDFKSLRNNYENKLDSENEKVYEEIIKIIGDDIDSVFDEKSTRSGEKKILAPTVVFIKDGKFVGLHVKSVDSQLKSTDELSDEQLKELKKIYNTYIYQLNANVCSDGC